MSDIETITVEPDSVCQLDSSELACRIAEAMMMVKRKPGMSAEEALESMGEMAANFYIRGANAALSYVLERFGNNASRIQ